MFGNKKLNEKIQDLEEEVKGLGLELDKQVKLSKFLLDHKKDDVVAKIVNVYNWFYPSWYTHKLEVEYLYDNEIKNVDKDLGNHEFKVENVENINNKVAIIKIKNNYGETKIIQLDKTTNELVEITLLAQHFTDVGKKMKKMEKVSADIDAVAESQNKYDKNGIKTKEPVNSALMTYYHKYNLDLSIKHFSPIKRLSEKEAATLLYLFDHYKYVNEIVKHIDLSRNSIITYAYTLRKAGYLIYSNEMGRVANGCLVYNEKAV